MRVNVYSQELTSEVKLVEKEGVNSDGDKEVFHGVRLFLHSPEQLHDTPNDDDRSAITLWLPKSSARRFELAEALYNMADLVDAQANTAQNEERIKR